MRAKVEDLGAGVFKTTKGEGADDEAPANDTKVAKKKQKKAATKKLAKKAGVPHLPRAPRRATRE